MGVPIEFPPSPPPRFAPTHSAKPSWSNSSSSSTHYQLPPPNPNATSSSSSSSSSSFTYPPVLSHPRHQLLHDDCPPLSSLAYVPPPPPSIWGGGSASSMRSPLLTHSPVSMSSPASPARSYSPFPAGLGEWAHPPQRALLDHPHMQVRSEVLLSRSTRGREIDIESPSPTRARAHPNLRRISRVPVFLAAASSTTEPTSAVLGSTGYSTAAPAGTSTTISGNGTIAEQRTTHTMTDTQTPLTTARTGNLVWHPSSQNYLTRSLPPPPASPSLSSSLNAPSGSSSQQQHSGAWNRRLVNSNHADNHSRVDILERIGYSTSEYDYNDQGQPEQQQQRRHQHQQERQRLYQNSPYSATTNSISPVNAPSSSSSPEPGVMQDVEMQDMSQHRLMAPNSVLESSPVSTLPSFLQGLPSTARTVVRAHAVHQGVVHIYPENHEPIYMYGRPILSPLPSPLPSPSPSL